MCIWKDEELQLPILKVSFIRTSNIFIYYLHTYMTLIINCLHTYMHVQDGYELRKQFMAQLLTYKENECEDNMPAGVRDFLSCINATQS